MRCHFAAALCLAALPGLAAMFGKGKADAAPGRRRRADGNAPVRWPTRRAAEQEEQDLSCPGLDQFPSDVGCQLRCKDDNCTQGWMAMAKAGGTHLVMNCCAPYTGCIATVKKGADPLAGLPGDACERQCAARLSRSAYYRLSLSRRTGICRARGSGNSSSQLAMIADYLWMRNVAIDFGKTSCNSRSRKFAPGFLRANCAPRDERSVGASIPRHLEQATLLASGISTGSLPAECAGGRPRTPEEERFTVFVARDDMGNYAHHLGDMLAVFQVFDHLQLQPHEAQVVLLDAKKLMCWGGACNPDCKGPFAQLWPVGRDRS